MAARSANVNVRVEPDVEKQAEDAFDEMMQTGLTQAKKGNSIPFEEAFDLLTKGL